MKKHMKKALALLLCTLMIVTAALPVFAVDAEPKATTTHDGKLAITEIVIKASAEVFNYIEILNTSSETLDLSEYYLYIFGFDNGSAKYGATSTEQLLALDNRGCQNIAAVQLNGTIAPGQVKLIMINDGWYDNKAEGASESVWVMATPKYFVAYWNKLGANITEDDVIEVDIPYTLSARYISPSTDAETKEAERDGSSNDMQHNLLPRNTHGTCSVALIPADKAIDHEDNPVTESGVIFDGGSAAGAQRSIKNILKGADSIVLINTLAYNNTSATSASGSHANYPAGKAVNFYSFIEEESFNAAVDATAASQKTAYYYDDLYPALETTGEYEPLMNFDDYTQATVRNSIIMPKVRFGSDPTPGRLNGTQFGFSEYGPLAITEVCARPNQKSSQTEAEVFRYVEILNTSDNAVDLSKYYLYRAGFSNTSGIHYEVGSKQMLGLSGNKAAKLAAVKLIGTIGPGEVKVLWLHNYDNTKTVQNFVEYWNSYGASLETSDVIDIKIYSDIYAGRDVSSAGDTFLPRNTYLPIVLGLVNEAYTIEGTYYDAGSNYNAYYRNIVSETQKSVDIKQLWLKADCIVSLNMMNGNHAKAANIDSYSAHFSDFIEEKTYNASVDAATLYPGKTIAKYYYANMYPSLAVSNPYMPCQVLTQCGTGWDWTTATSGIALPEIDFNHRATPGELDGIQYGHGSDKTPGPLAITEVVNSAPYGDKEFEYVEIYNTSNNEVELQNYTMFLFYASNGGGQYLGAGVGTVYGAGQNIDANNHSFANLSSASKKLAGGNTAVLWFDNTEATVSDFKAYWTAKGNDMTNVDVIKVAYTAGSNVATRGKGFLPEYKATYSLALLDSTKKDTLTGLNSAYGKATTVSSAVVTSEKDTIVMHSDCISFHITHGLFVSNLAQNLYSYAGDDLIGAQKILGEARANGAVCVMAEETRVYPNLLMTKNPTASLYAISSVSYSESWALGANVSETLNYNSTTFFDYAFDSVPTPGKLVDGQFDKSSDAATLEIVGTQTTDVVDGVTTLRIVGYIDSLDYDDIKLELYASTAATDDTKSTAATPSTTASLKTKKTLTTTTVYKTVTDSEGNEYTAKTFGKDSGYLFTIVITNVPVENVKLTVKATAGNVTTGIYEISDFT